LAFDKDLLRRRPPGATLREPTTTDRKGPTAPYELRDDEGQDGGVLRLLQLNAQHPLQPPRRPAQKPPTSRSSKGKAAGGQILNGSAAIKHKLLGGKGGDERSAPPVLFGSWRGLAKEEDIESRRGGRRGMESGLHLLVIYQTMLDPGGPDGRRGGHSDYPLLLRTAAPLQNSTKFAAYTHTPAQFAPTQSRSQPKMGESEWGSQISTA
ncbi:hypothetical protein BDK51DRAFT_30002, partial [Blyttiomyces helicus]